MMTHSTSFIVLVAALLSNALSYCSAENVYCVTPTATSCSSCPHNDHCATLSEYAQEAEMYFTSNTTIAFLPGDHVLDRNITVANVTRLMMHGESSSCRIATVVRNGSVGFSFTNMVDFNIYFLAFTFYNRSLSYGSLSASSSALFLQSTQNAKLVNCSFHDNLGTALVVNNTNVTLTENKFTNNQCGCKSFTKRCRVGCGITALNSTLKFTGNTTFLENNASFGYSAGAIWASASSLHLTGTNNFTGNSADYDGGAIYAESNTSLSFTGTSDFSHNSAKSGGAIYTADSVAAAFKMEKITLVITLHTTLVVQFTHHTMLYLPSMEPTTLSTTQQTQRVVQFIQHITYGVNLLVLPFSVTTVQFITVVVQSTQNVVLYSPSLEPTVSSTTTSTIYHT